MIEFPTDRDYIITLDCSSGRYRYHGRLVILRQLQDPTVLHEHKNRSLAIVDVTYPKEQLGVGGVDTAVIALGDLPAPLAHRTCDGKQQGAKSDHMEMGMHRISA